MKRAILVLVAIFGSSQSAWPYETDVHYAFTNWLATQAGFDAGEADLIANSDQDLDRNKKIDGHRRDAVYIVPNEIIFESSLASRVKASGRVWTDHFVSEEPPSDSPANRMVKPGHGNRYLPKRFNDILASKYKGQKEWFRDIGFNLHAWQDSWSHQGKPGIPADPFIAFREKESWGHPDDRGGWWRHSADVTCADVKSAKEMAKTSFDHLNKLCTAFKGGGKCKSMPKDFDDRVGKFIKANTRQAKRDWFIAEKGQHSVDTSAQGFLEDIDLPKLEYKSSRFPVESCNSSKMNASRDSLSQPRSVAARSVVSGKFIRVQNSNACNEDSAYRQHSGNFLKWWLHDLPAYDHSALSQPYSAPIAPRVDEFFDRERLAPQIGAWASRGGAKSLEESVWLVTFLGMWLVEDHGLVEALGHGFPLEPGFSLLNATLRLARANEAPSPEITRAMSMRPIEPSEVVITRLTVPDDLPGVRGTCALTVHFPTRAPRDAVMFISERQGERWRITQVSWNSL